MMNTKILRQLLAVLVLILLRQPVNGQSSVPATELSGGDTIRVTVTPNSVLEGRLAALRTRSLTLWLNQREVSIPLKNIRKLEVARETKRNTGKGMAIGALTGGLGFGSLFAISVAGEQDGWMVPTPGQAFAAGLIGGSLLGGITGALIGRGHKSTRWEKVPWVRAPVHKRTLLPHSKSVDSLPVQTQKKQVAARRR